MRFTASLGCALAVSLLAGCGLLATEIAPCADDDGCPQGFVCDEPSGLCQSKPKPDAARPDAGPQRDAGAPDSSACACKISETCYQIGEHNPFNACVWCQPSASASSWTAIDSAHVCSGNDRLWCAGGTGTLDTGCWKCEQQTGECCGVDFQPCCSEQPQCVGWLRCQAHQCEPACGLLGEPCCPDDLGSEPICFGLTCCPDPSVGHCSDDPSCT